MIVVLFVLMRYNHVKCISYEYALTGSDSLQPHKMYAFAVKIAVLFVLKRYSHIKCTPYESVADNYCSIICIKEIQPRNMYNSRMVAVFIQRVKCM